MHQFLAGLSTAITHLIPGSPVDPHRQVGEGNVYDALYPQQEQRRRKSATREKKIIQHNDIDQSLPGDRYTCHISSDTSQQGGVDSDPFFRVCVYSDVPRCMGVGVWVVFVFCVWCWVFGISCFVIRVLCFVSCVRVRTVIPYTSFTRTVVQTIIHACSPRTRSPPRLRNN